MNDYVLILFLLLPILLIIVGVALKSRLESTKFKIVMLILAVIIIISGIMWRLLHGGF
jgi:hypothetical protein